jgi:hypothetical protein
MARPKQYLDELIARGVRIALQSERPIAHIAADLGTTFKGSLQHRFAREGKSSGLVVDDLIV